MKPEVVNVVATADLQQRVSLTDISRLPYTIHDQEIYGGRVAYLKTPEMHGKVTIFPSGKLISVGTRSLQQAQEDIQTTKQILLSDDLIEPVELTTTIRNLVAVLTLPETVDLEKLAQEVNVIYEPEQFPGAIIKTKQPKATHLVFNSGKIVISGTRSIQELQEAANWITEILNKV